MIPVQREASRDSPDAPAGVRGQWDPHYDDITTVSIASVHVRVNAPCKTVRYITN